VDGHCCIVFVADLLDVSMLALCVRSRKYRHHFSILSLHTVNVAQFTLCSTCRCCSCRRALSPASGR